MRGNLYLAGLCLLLSIPSLARAEGTEAWIPSGDSIWNSRKPQSAAVSEPVKPAPAALVLQSAPQAGKIEGHWTESVDELVNKLPGDN